MEILLRESYGSNIVYVGITETVMHDDNFYTENWGGILLDE